MLAISCLGATCPSSDPNALVQKLTSISVGPIQPIDEATAKGIADELVSTVRCNAEDAARKVLVPAVVVAGISAIGAGIAAFLLIRRSPGGLAGAARASYKRSKKAPEPVYFVDPRTGDLIEVDYGSAEYKKLRGRGRGLGTRYRVTVRTRKFPMATSLCVEARNKVEAAELVKGGGTKVNIVRVVRGC